MKMHVMRTFSVQGIHALKWYYYSTENVMNRNYYRFFYHHNKLEIVINFIVVITER